MSHIQTFKICNYYKDNGKALRHLKQKKHSDIFSKTRLDSGLAKPHELSSGKTSVCSPLRSRKEGIQQYLGVCRLWYWIIFICMRKIESSTLPNNLSQRFNLFCFVFVCLILTWTNELSEQLAFQLRNQFPLEQCYWWGERNLFNLTVF